jgi:hypothetical protein
VCTIASARAAIVGAVLVAAMVSSSCWFQASTTLSPVAARAGATPTRAASPTLATSSTTTMVGSLRAMASTCLGLVRTGTSAEHAGAGGRSSRQTLAEPSDRNKVDGVAKLGDRSSYGDVPGR